jgi:hypothetical protein
MVHSLTGIDWLLPSGEAGKKTLDEAKDSQLQMHVQLGHALKDFATRISNDERNKEIKVDEANRVADLLEGSETLSDLEQAPIHHQEKPLLVFANSGTSGVGSTDPEDTADARIRALGEVDDTFENLPPRFVVTTVAPSGCEAGSKVLSVHFLTQYVGSKTVAQEGLCNQDTSGIVNSKPNSAEMNAAALHGGKFMMNTFANLVQIGTEPHLSRFIDLYFKTGALPFLFTQRPFIRQPDSDEALECGFLNTPILDVPTLLTRFGIEVSEEWMNKNITSSSGYFREVDAKEVACIQFKRERTPFKYSGFTNVLDVSAPIIEFASSPVKWYVLPLTEQKPREDVWDLSTGEAFLEKKMGKKNPREFFLKGEAIPYVVMA